MNYQILKHESDNSFFQNLKNLKIVDDISKISKHDPMIIGGDILRLEVRTRLNEKSPTIYIHRGYLGNHLFKNRKWWRYSVNGFANTKLLEIPYSRWDLLNSPRHPWKVKKVEHVLIAPSKMTGNIWNPEVENWAESMLDKFPGAEVKIRPKGARPRIRWATLWEDLDWADLVVSQASAITAEAFWYGKKVISLHPCVTWAAGEQSLEDWKNSEEPELRDQWHEHLAWCQFRNEEWESGKATELIEKYIGQIDLYDPEHQYNFK
jgi:hypothetical protein